MELSRQESGKEKGCFGLGVNTSERAKGESSLLFQKEMKKQTIQFQDLPGASGSAGQEVLEGIPVGILHLQGIPVEILQGIPVEILPCIMRLSKGTPRSTIDYILLPFAWIDSSSFLLFAIRAFFSFCESPAHPRLTVC